MFRKRDYERLSESLQTSEEFLYAIECVSGASFERSEDGNIIDNAARKLWEEGGRMEEILTTLPTEQAEEAEEGEDIFWSDLKANFDGRKWISDDIKFGIFNKLLNEFVTTDGENPESKNIRKFDSYGEAQERINENPELAHKYQVKLII